jgi:hypothetical protein
MKTYCKYLIENSIRSILYIFRLYMNDNPFMQWLSPGYPTKKFKKQTIQYSEEWEEERKFNEPFRQEDLYS